ncbi:amidase [Microbacterium sp. NPDC055683]
MDDILRSTARAQLALLARGEVSARDLLAAALERQASVGREVNAVVSVDVGIAEAAAAASDARRASGAPLGALDGLPTAFKDLEEAAGFRTTWGSTRFRGHVSHRDSEVVGRIRAAGAVPYGKTNTPEFGTGSHTLNAVFGTTRNPYAPDRSAGGSSGGAAAALAAGLVSVADGSDMGGSLRNPASFCNVVGVRPTPGLVSMAPAADPWATLPVKGPMARTTGDAALLLSVLAGASGRSPLSQPGDVSEFARIAYETPRADALDGLRVLWCPTVGGLDVEQRVRGVLDEHGRRTLEAAGAVVVEDELVAELAGADDAFRIPRAFAYAMQFGALLDEHSDAMSPELVANARWGLTITPADLWGAQELRGALFARFADLFDRCDVIAAPAAAAAPFPAERRWVDEIEGSRQGDYLDWMRAAWRFTPLGGASLSVPCGFTPEGLPVGLQLVGPPRSEARLLRIAAAFEERVPAWRETPAVLRAGTPPRD